MKHLQKFENYNEIDNRFDYDQEYGPRKKGSWIFDYPGNEKYKEELHIDSGESNLEDAKDVIYSELQGMGLLGEDVDDVKSNEIVFMTPGYRFVIERFFKWKPQLTFEEFIESRTNEGLDLEEDEELEKKPKKRKVLKIPGFNKY